MGDIGKALDQLRPVFGLIGAVLSAVGSILIAVGIIKFFGVQMPIRGSGLELAVAGFLIKAL